MQDSAGPPKEEPESEFAATDCSGDDATDDAYVDNIGIDVNDCDPPKEDPESKFVDVYNHPFKEEPELELGGGDWDAVDITSYCIYVPPKEEPEPKLEATDDAFTDGSRDVDYDCSYCGINLSTHELKVKHELRCEVQVQEREPDSSITKLYHCGYCKCPFVNKEYKEKHQEKWCRKKPVAKRRDSNGSYFECDKCKFVTKWKENIERHVLNHNKNTAEWFTCTQCSYKTVHKKDMTTHMKIHSSNSSCCCPLCVKSFKTKRYLDEHLLMQHSDESDEVSKLITSKIHSCNICDQYRTTSKTRFNDHVTLTHHQGVGRQKYQCPRCPYSTFRNSDLTKHSKTHEEHRCTVCKEQFSQKRALHLHVLSNHADKVDLAKKITSKMHRSESSTTNVCNFDIDGNHDYHSFKEEAESEVPAMGVDAVADDGRYVSYDCSHCRISLSSREFKVEHELRCKVRMEQKELESQVTKLYHCGYCRCPFVSKEFKEQHQQKCCPKKPVATRMDSNDAHFECDKCEFVTTWKQSLVRHSLNHNKNNVEWITCTQCSYKTVHKNDMTTHMKIHGNNFSCCCPICGKSFRTKRCLDDHLLKLHFDDSDEVSKLITSKFYTCDICNKYRTVVKSCFNEHLSVTHLKGAGCQKYQCPLCPYSTFRKYHLKKHLKTHMKQKDYQCPVCKKQFTEKTQLDSHILCIHAHNVDLVKTITSKVHRCESCSFKTVKVTDLKSHIQKKHA